MFGPSIFLTWLEERVERIGLAAQGGDSVAGFKGVLEDVQRILDEGRIGRVLAMAAPGIAISRQAETAQA